MLVVKERTTLEKWINLEFATTREGLYFLNADEFLTMRNTMITFMEGWHSNMDIFWAYYD